MPHFTAIPRLSRAWRITAALLALLLALPASSTRAAPTAAEEFEMFAQAEKNTVCIGESVDVRVTVRRAVTVRERRFGKSIIYQTVSGMTVKGSSQNNQVGMIDPGSAIAGFDVITPAAWFTFTGVKPGTVVVDFSSLIGAAYLGDKQVRDNPQLTKEAKAALKFKVVKCHYDVTGVFKGSVDSQGLKINMFGTMPTTLLEMDDSGKLSATSDFTFTTVYENLPSGCSAMVMDIYSPTAIDGKITPDGKRLQTGWHFEPGQLFITSSCDNASGSVSVPADPTDLGLSSFEIPVEGGSFDVPVSGYFPGAFTFDFVRVIEE